MKHAPAPDRRRTRSAGPAGALDGLTVLVTGAGRGVGRLFCDALAQAGARLVLAGRDRAVLDAAVAELGARGLEALAAPADLTVPDSLARAVDRAEGVFGGVDVLVNNAGVAGPLGPLWETDEEDWWRTFEVNLRGTAHACRAVLPGMVARRSGRIVNVVSEAGYQRWPHASVSKAAVIKLTENLAAEARPHGVQVLSYHPGLLDTGITRRHLERHPTGNPWEDRVGEWLLAERDAGRFTAPEQSAAALVRIVGGAADAHCGQYLTPDSDFITGP